MKIKHFFLVPILLFLVVLATVFYYKFDPSLLTNISFYVNLANPYMRIVKVDPGLRKEQIAEVLEKKLDWEEQEKDEFINLANVEGHYFPKTYLIFKDEKPSTVTANMMTEFNNQIKKVKKPKSMKVINEEMALKIASMIEREAAGKHDMNLISGILWNRIFSDMKLQVDATLQYAKGNEEDGWWRKVTPEDKKLDSSYNTYKYEGLPPSPIANPSLEAIVAAYNPQKTSCMFYLHDKNRKIHCAKTYEQHKKNIEKYLR